MENSDRRNNITMMKSDILRLYITVGFLWLVILLIGIVECGGLRKNRQKLSVEVTALEKSISEISEKITAHEKTIHYGRKRHEK